MVSNDDPMLDPSMRKVDSKQIMKGNPNICIIGAEQQIMQVRLMPGESIMVEPGCMCYADAAIEKEVDMGECSDCLKRSCCANESAFRVIWQNEGSQPHIIGLTPQFPAQVIPVNIDQHQGEVIIKRGSFMAATDTEIKFHIERVGRDGGGTLSKGVMGGQGFFLNKLEGQGWVFLNASGAIFEKILESGETLVVDQDSVVAWAASVKFGWRRAGSVGMICCGGEGFANTTLTGPGWILIQSMPFERVRALMTPPSS